jgi:hypothetical protein
MDGRGLACPIRPQKPEDDARRYFKGQIVERFNGAKGAG